VSSATGQIRPRLALGLGGGALSFPDVRLLRSARPLLPVDGTGQDGAAVVATVGIVAEVPTIRVMRFALRSVDVLRPRPPAPAAQPAGAKERFTGRPSAGPRMMPGRL